jgi:hypothetical protein
VVRSWADLIDGHPFGSAHVCQDILRRMNLPRPRPDSFFINTRQYTLSHENFIFLKKFLKPGLWLYWVYWNLDMGRSFLVCERWNIFFLTGRNWSSRRYVLNYQLLLSLVKSWVMAWRLFKSPSNLGGKGFSRLFSFFFSVRSMGAFFLESIGQ